MPPPEAPPRSSARSAEDAAVAARGDAEGEDDVAPTASSAPSSMESAEGPPPATTEVVEAPDRRGAGRRLLSVLSVVLILAGAGLLAYPLVTDVYAEHRLQRPLEDRFVTVQLRDRYVTRTVAVGDPLTRITIPDLGVSSLVVSGTSSAALRAGAGHYPGTPLPGEVGNVGIAGHRTTYGRPFERIDELEVGSEILLETPLAVHTYRVVGPPEGADKPCPNGACWIVPPSEWGVVGPTEDAVLTLTTCHPRGSARQRLILRAELVESRPRHDEAWAA